MKRVDELVGRMVQFQRELRSTVATIEEIYKALHKTESYLKRWADLCGGGVQPSHAQISTFGLSVRRIGDASNKLVEARNAALLSLDHSIADLREFALNAEGPDEAQLDRHIVATLEGLRGDVGQTVDAYARITEVIKLVWPPIAAEEVDES